MSLSLRDDENKVDHPPLLSEKMHPQIFAKFSPDLVKSMRAAVATARASYAAWKQDRNDSVWSHISSDLKGGGYHAWLKHNMGPAGERWSAVITENRMFVKFKYVEDLAKFQAAVTAGTLGSASALVQQSPEPSHAQ